MNNFEIQSALADFGLYHFKVDGLYGFRTKDAIKALLKKYAPNHRVPEDNPSRMLIGAEQVIMKVIGGLAVGPIDGIVGPATTKARKHWQQGPWRNALMVERKGDERMPLAVQNTWPLHSQMEKFYGAPGTNQVLFYTPYPLRLYTAHGETVHRFSCHTKVKDSISRVMRKVLDHYGYERIVQLELDIFGGCLNVRAMRGGKQLSVHAYGAACDWNPAKNGLKSTRATAQFARPEYEAWWDAWTAEGWLSLGKARDFDWMHVQAARLG